MQANFTASSKNAYVVIEGDFSYTMPFVLKHLLDKYLVYVKEDTTNLPIANWYFSLTEDRQQLVKLKRTEDKEFCKN